MSHFGKLLGLGLLGLLPLRSPAQPTSPPLPATAQGDNIPYPKGYIVKPLGEGLYYVGDGIYNAMFLVYDRGVVAVDAPPSLGANYLAAIREVTALPVTHVVYSHSHTDHIGSASLFPKSAQYIAQDETGAILRRRRDPRRPVPTVTFAKSYTLKVGSQTLQLDYRGPNHEAGNIFIYAPRQKALMIVDIVYPGWVAFKNLGISHDVQSYIEAHDDILTYDFTTLVPGHVNRTGTRQDVLVAKQFLRDLHANAVASFQAISFAESAQQTGTEDKWKLYDTYFRKVVDETAHRTRAQWAGKLGSLDTYLTDNAWIMCETVNVELPPGYTFK